MYFEGYFSKGIFSLFNEIVDIRSEIINQLNDGCSRSDDIRDAISESYVVNEDDLDIDFEKYVTVNEDSIRLDLDSNDTYYVIFAVDCDFDMERFALDHELESRDIER